MALTTAARHGLGFLSRGADAGNGAGVQADGGPLHGFVASASIVIPANGVVVFVKG